MYSKHTIVIKLHADGSVSGQRDGWTVVRSNDPATAIQDAINWVSDRT